jgi:four helix bundle protein
MVMSSSSSARPRFAHEHLDAYRVAREALAQGEPIARELPRGYATLADQLRRALLSAFLGVAEAAGRTGADRLARFRCARGEASEAAAALEAVQMLGLAQAERVQPVVELLARLYALLTALAKAGR